ncbi:MAG: aminoglycoside phosphotransferase family protein [Candidatus Melainabacteria bacterium]|nr:aminoglycoside phosphotransferase family protein [Candidatus Melainabacteria bacterium]
MVCEQAGGANGRASCAAEVGLQTESEFIGFVTRLSNELGFEGRTVEKAQVEDLSGNINRVRRVKLWFAGGQRQSFVVKHVPEGGRLERYPSIIFPENRLSFEVAWFHLSKQIEHEHAVCTPAVLYFSQDQRTVIMEDLAPLCSLGDWLRHNLGSKPEDLLKTLGAFLGQIHQATVDSVAFSNPGAALNRPYVFTLALKEPAQMRAIWEEQVARRASMAEEERNCEIKLMRRIGLQERYLRKSRDSVLPVLIELERTFKQGQWSVLTHGDLHTDSVLVLSDSRLGVVDAELCDHGSPAFDVGMLCAHMWACAVASGLSQDGLVARLVAFFDGYIEEFWSSVQAGPDEKLVVLQSTALHCGAEILRRLLGAAGFSFSLTDAQFEELLETATKLLLCPAEWARKWVAAVNEGR